MKNMKKSIRKILLTSLGSLSILPTTLVVISCQDKNQIKKNDNDKSFEIIKNKYINLNWNDFLLSKAIDETKNSYKNFSFESFFEWKNNGKLHSLDEIEINSKTEDLQSKESIKIDNFETSNNYLSEEFNNLLNSYNLNKTEDEKLIVVFRSQKLPMPEASILVWSWLTTKKYLNESKNINEIKYLEKNKIILYGHWFYNEEYEQQKNSNKIWKILSYAVPSIAIGGLFLYIIIAILIKRKKVAFKNKKK
ncbi:hypothetical protein [Mycoplasmopsis arginini]|uniref:hypothetical protein n=1 Tax=Mycoplasmopsis arginini TaxID=2094 RepID=UPI002736E0BC|nr:hypothetical protein [Mycoplasmopsis arginini]MDP4043191.1 hypothetical protein [Mycoplasmopsis arginini]